MEIRLRPWTQTGSSGQCTAARCVQHAPCTVNSLACMYCAMCSEINQYCLNRCPYCSSTVWSILGVVGSKNSRSRIGHSRMVHSRYGPFWEWSVLEMVVLGMVVLGLVQVPPQWLQREPHIHRMRGDPKTIQAEHLHLQGEPPFL